MMRKKKEIRTINIDKRKNMEKTFQRPVFKKLNTIKDSYIEL